MDERTVKKQQSREDGKDISAYVFDWKNPRMNTTPGGRQTQKTVPEKNAKPQEPVRTETSARSAGRSGAKKASSAVQSSAKRASSAPRSGVKTASLASRSHAKTASSSRRTASRATGGANRGGRTAGRRRKSRRRRIRVWFNRILALAVFLLLLAALIWSFSRLLGFLHRGEKAPNADLPEYVEEDLLTVNPYSRPGLALEEVKSIVIHYTANPGTTAKQNRDYFEGLAGEENAASDKPVRASSHFVIGIEGEILCCVPQNEVAYASNDRNLDSLSIECCHEDKSGQFSEATYQSLIKLTAWLCRKYHLTSDDIIRHYDVNGKNCPKYYVENEDAWTKLKQDVAQAME